MPTFSITSYVSSLLFGGFGLVAFTYGKRMHVWTPMLCGLAMMLLPLFAEDLALFIGSAILGAIAIIFRHN